MSMLLEKHSKKIETNYYNLIPDFFNLIEMYIKVFRLDTYTVNNCVQGCSNQGLVTLVSKDLIFDALPSSFFQVRNRFLIMQSPFIFIIQKLYYKKWNKFWEIV